MKTVPSFMPDFCIQSTLKDFHSIRFHRLLWTFIVIDVYYHLQINIVYFLTF